MAKIPLILPTKYDSLKNESYSCIVCGKLVGSTEQVSYDQLDNLILRYSPSSKYFCADGVFCGIECSFKWYEEKINEQ